MVWHSPFTKKAICDPFISGRGRKTGVSTPGPLRSGKLLAPDAFLLGGAEGKEAVADDLLENSMSFIISLL